MNEILKNFDINALRKQKCQKCSQPRFYLMKSFCCKGFICVSCCLNGMAGKCVVCRKLPFRTTDGLRHSLKDVCLALFKTLKIKNEFEAQSLENIITTHTKLPNNKEAEKLSFKQLVEIIIPKVKVHWPYVLNPENETCARSYLPSFNIKCCSFLFSVLLQLHLMYQLTQNYRCSINWISSNFMTSTIIAGFSKDHNKLKYDQEIYEELIRELDEIILTWLKLLFPFFVFLGDTFVNHFIILLLISFLTKPIIHIFSKQLVQNLKYSILEEEKYHFY